MIGTHSRVCMIQSSVVVLSTFVYKTHLKRRDNRWFRKWGSSITPYAYRFSNILYLRCLRFFPLFFRDFYASIPVLILQ